MGKTEEKATRATEKQWKITNEIEQKKEKQLKMNKKTVQNERCEEHKKMKSGNVSKRQHSLAKN